MIKTEYRISGAVNINIAIVADLHEYDPKPVLSILREVRPDIIAVPGDLMERYSVGDDLDEGDENWLSHMFCRLIDLIEVLDRKRWDKKHDRSGANSHRFLLEANKIAPVVMSLGNHELYFTEADEAVLRDNHICLLNNSMTRIKGVLFGGIPSRRTSGRIDTDFLSRFSRQEGYKVLLCHHPEYYPQLAGYDMDLIISGHCHGGQIRIGNRGIYAPGQGLMPKYYHGLYDNRLVVSSGCSNTTVIPRLGNQCEVAVVRVSR